MVVRHVRSREKGYSSSTVLNGQLRGLSKLGGGEHFDQHSAVERCFPRQGLDALFGHLANPGHILVVVLVVHHRVERVQVPARPILAHQASRDARGREHSSSELLVLAMCHFHQSVDEVGDLTVAVLAPGLVG